MIGGYALAERCTHPKALSEAERMQTWWRENRSDFPALFDDELADTIGRICAKPGVGSPYPASR